MESQPITFIKSPENLNYTIKKANRDNIIVSEKNFKKEEEEKKKEENNYKIFKKKFHGTYELAEQTSCLLAKFSGFQERETFYKISEQIFSSNSADEITDYKRSSNSENLFFYSDENKNEENKSLIKNSLILLNRHELFHLYLSELFFENRQNNFEESKMIDNILKTHENFFKSGIKNFKKTIFNKETKITCLDYIKSKNKEKGSKNKNFIHLSKNIEENVKIPSYLNNIKKPKSRNKILSYYIAWAFYNYFPILTWFPQYNWKKYLKNDLIAGITVGVMLIAQGMAYAKLAGLAPEYGLYSSGLPLLVYPFFGTSRHLGVGPVALVSLLVSQVTMSTNKAGHDYSQNEKTSFALLIAFCVGLTQIFMGLIKIGFIINFISHPVIAGFTTAAAFVIILSQLQHVLGYNINKSHYPFITLYNYFINIKKFRWQPFFFGTVNILFMQFIKFINMKYKFELPGPIICVFLSISITQTFKLDRFGISIQNKIPRGFPDVKGPIFNEFTKVAPTVLTISFINFLETIAIASKIGEMHGYKIVPDQELIGSGMTNLIGSFVGAFPMAGSFSRTAVLSQAGAKTQVAGMITGLVIILTYLFFTPLFTYLPNVTLASIILVSVVNLIDYKEALHLLKIRFLDFFAFMISLVSTFVFGVEWGIAMAVGVSLVFVLWFSIKPPTSVLGRIPGTVVYRDIKWYTGCVKTPGGILFRMDAPLFFVNSAVLRKKIYQEEEKYTEINPVNLFYIILDCRGMTDIDSTGLQVISEIAEKYNKQGVFIGLANVNERVRKLMRAGHLDNLIKPENFFSRIHDGVEAAVKWKIYHLKQLN